MDSAFGTSDSPTDGTVETSRSDLVSTEGPISPFRSDMVSTEDTVETFRFDPIDENLVVDIAEAVASVANEDVLEFTPRVNDAIDADALTRCLRSADETLRITFSLGGYRLIATGYGRLYITQLN